MPLLAQQFKQFGFVWWLVTIHLPLDHIPEVFNEVQAWRMGWPWQGFDLVVLLPHLDWGMEHCPAGQTNPQRWGMLSEQKEARFLSGQPFTWLYSCILLKDKSSQFQPCWSSPRSSLILHQIQQWSSFAWLQLCPLRNLIRTVLVVHFTPATVCHSFCRSLDVILQLLNDIQINWRSSQSVEGRRPAGPIAKG